MSCRMGIAVGLLGLVLAAGAVTTVPGWTGWLRPGSPADPWSESRRLDTARTEMIQRIEGADATTAAWSDSGAVGSTNPRQLLRDWQRMRSVPSRR